ncbi:type III restriction enzyme, res subunit [Hirsutella rhossiliensis]|uniref:Type III restriction enzyme, res subunit domain-containing protein n=1 Tax=Hirsutella rhossiliensis TaxID=111463 RepID=A0A9P8SH17_9HYPO|nr:type III restriction enzyme, res subunit domain-containing protein [Hirsutella rhossiliensis]KAH0961070.1 type III restriction enzyme, res subunit domain-containing protein [Hirsutella rhossiliensis]
MPSFKANNFRDQWAMIKQSIPHQTDNRRKSTQKKDLEEASKLFGYQKVKAVDGKWLYKKMKTALWDYQITAAAWMIKRELDRLEPNGGVLADAMGMGKTLMALTCVAANPPEGDDVTMFSRTTLVVVPNQSTALYWLEETERHCREPLGSYVSVYNSKDPKPLGHLRRMRLLITTYGELIRQYPSDKVISELKEKYEGNESSLGRALAQKTGFLFKQKWHRVILDEAHAIKNIASRTTKVCCALQSKHHWALSGTPLANSAEEFYPYLKFIRCHYTDCPATFKRKYMTNGKANDGFETLVSMIMYRRTMNDTFLGYRMIDLPKSKSRDIWVPLSREEEFIQETIEREYEEKTRKLEKALKLVKNAEAIDRAVTRLKLTMLTKLREAASHVFNLEKLLRGSMDIETVRRLKAGSGENSPKKPVLDQIMSSDDGKKCLEGFETGVARLRELQEPVFGGEFEWGALLDRVLNEQKVKGLTCSHCEATPPEQPVRFDPCGHYYCKRCFAEITASFFLGGPTRVVSNAQQEMQCSQTGCGQRVRERTPLETIGCIGFQSGECPDDKIIVFVQFIMTGKVLGRMLEGAGISFLYYTGALSQQQKNKALGDFAQDPTKKILISTMRCGGQSLNLTSANRVIIVDPWWNTTAEKQAFARVVRIGQKKESHLVRIMACESIDSRISDLQISKDVGIDHALQDDGHIPAVLGDEELEELLNPKSSARAAKQKSSQAKGKSAKNAATRRR